MMVHRKATLLVIEMPSPSKQIQCTVVRAAQYSCYNTGDRVGRVQPSLHQKSEFALSLAKWIGAHSILLDSRSPPGRIRQTSAQLQESRVGIEIQDFFDSNNFKFIPC